MKIWKRIKKWNELWVIPIGVAGLVLWHYAQDIFNATGFDGTIGAYDGSVLMNVVFSIIATSILSGTAWLLIKLSFPKVYKVLDDLFSDIITSPNGLTKWEKVKVSLWLFTLYFAVLAYLVNGI